jgi:hypothetical protein
MTKKLPASAKKSTAHYWIGWNGGTSDANSLALFAGTFNGRVLYPTGYTSDNNTPDPKKLNPCEYDFAQLHKCITDEVKLWNTKVFGLCHEWTSHLWTKCQAASKT